VGSSYNIYVRQNIKTAIFDSHYSYLTSNWIKSVSVYRKIKFYFISNMIKRWHDNWDKTFIIYVGTFYLNKLITNIII